jgi:hypothetical protein
MIYFRIYQQQKIWSWDESSINGDFFCFIMCFGFANLIYVGVSENGGWHKCRWTLCVHYHWECTIGNGPPIVCHSKNKRTWIGRKRRSYTFLNHDWLVVWNMFFSLYIGQCHDPNWRTPSFFRGVGIPPTSMRFGLFQARLRIRGFWRSQTWSFDGVLFTGHQGTRA